MAEVPKIVLPHGGYRNLIVYRKSDVIYQGTVVFCRRFLPSHGDRTVDQMTQAARSCKQNIAEGSAASGTSKETEIKLTNVARATLDELLEDYLDYLKSHGASEWDATSEKKTAARDFAKSHAEWSDWKPFFDSRERMHAARTAARGEDWDKAIYSRLDGAETTTELASRADEMRERITKVVWDIKKRKNW